MPEQSVAKRPILSQLRNALSPRGSRARKLRFGPARGVAANIDLSKDAAFLFGLHERPLHRHYRRLLRRGMKVFDVGMYRGWDALTFAWMTGDEVVSFDGNAKMMGQARQLIEPSGLAASITLVNSYVSDGASGMSLDLACETYFAPDFVKIDIEGAEGAALRGATWLLSEKRPSMVIETHGLDVENECLGTLRSHRYEVTVVDQPAGLLKEYRPTEHNRWIVCEPRAA